MQLVERGAIELDRDIRDYLPEGFLTRLSYSQPITMLNLMNHNAGWGDVVRDLYFFDASKSMDLGEYLDKYEPRQIYEPGTVVAYSNYGTSLAGYIVERVSGMPCWQYMRENIFDPLGMNDTTVHPTHQDRPDLAARRDAVKGYTPDRRLMPNHRSYWRLYLGAAAMGTIGDMAKFALALLPPEGAKSPLFDKREALDLMLSPSLYFPDGSPEQAHGFFVERRGDKTFFCHGGENVGFSSYLRLSLQTREALLIMTNTHAEVALRLGLADELLGSNNLRIPAEVGTPTAKQVTGVYLSARKYIDSFAEVNKYIGAFVVTAKDDTTLNVSGVGELAQVAPYRFTPTQDDATSWVGSVYFDPQDRAVHAQFYMSTDYIRMTTGQLVLLAILGVAFVLAALYSLVMLVTSGLRKLISKPAPSRLRVLRNTAHAFHLGVIVNVSLLGVSSLNFAEYSSLIPHFVVNALTLPVLVAYVAVFVKQVRQSPSRADVRLSVVTGLCLVTLLVTVVALNLWR